jgi:uncharacterized Ntn-hydrolase superfamily protein
MKLKLTTLLVLFIILSNYAQHTFSIVAVDPVTGEIGSAGATCIDAEDGALAISDIVLGVGAIHTQSYWDPTNQANAHNRMVAGDSPQEIIDWLIANDNGNNIALRQYGVVDLNNGNPKSAGYTGTQNYDEKINVNGPTYAIQGNILISQDVVTDMENAFTSTSGSLANRLMATMQAAKRPGADSRCLNLGVSSESAFLRVASPTDTDASYGNLSLDLNVWVTGTVFEPIDALQDAYDNVLSTSSNELKKVEVNFYPNPTDDSIIVRTTNTMITSYEIVNQLGKVITKQQVPIPKNHLYLDIKGYETGLYFVTVYNAKNKIATSKIIVK